MTLAFVFPRTIFTTESAAPVIARSIAAKIGIRRYHLLVSIQNRKAKKPCTKKPVTAVYLLIRINS